MRTGAVVGFLFGLWVTASCRVQHCRALQDDGMNLGGGVVHLVYSMKRKCVLCYKEVNKLLILKSQMEKFGHKMEVSVAMNKSPTANHRNRLPVELTVNVEDVWKQLGKKNGHIFIFDKCGKLAYQVITPWSKQNYPFTGMAALSAKLDDPCGECNVTMMGNLDPSTNNSSVHPASATPISKKKPLGRPEGELDYGGMRLRDSAIPLTIIYRSHHDHTVEGQNVSYNVVELRSDDPKYHGHAETAMMNHFNMTAEGTDYGNATEGEGVEMTDEPGRDSSTATPVEYDDDYSDEDESSSSGSPMNPTEVQELKRHYEPLMKWMSCAQQIMGS